MAAMRYRWVHDLTTKGPTHDSVACERDRRLLGDHHRRPVAIPDRSARRRIDRRYRLLYRSSHAGPVRGGRGRGRFARAAAAGTWYARRHRDCLVQNVTVCLPWGLRRRTGWRWIPVEQVQCRKATKAEAHPWTSLPKL